MGLSFTITEQIALQLQSLNNVVANTYAELNSSTLEELETLHKYARVSMVGSSTRIENAQLTDLEVNWIDTILTDDGRITAFQQNKELIQDKLSKDRERSIDEVAGCRAMLLEIYENYQHYVPLREADIRSLHHILIYPYEKARPIAGRYKALPNSVVERNHRTGQERIVLKTADAGPMTEIAMADLIKWYNQTVSQNMWSFAVACELVYRFLAIHPFQDGNGRLGRGLFLLSLLQSSSVPLSTVTRYLPIDRAIEKHKEQYYAVLNRCSDGIFKQDPREYHIEYFLIFMIKMLNEALEGIGIFRQKFAAQKNLSESARLVLSCFKEHPEVRLNTKGIIEFTKLPRRTVIYSLNNLLASRLIQKTGQGPAVKYQLVF